tara:strand:- start:1989 stop:2120 length:132 start_codon:yes stop_codon:yes gene_type:complete
MPTLKKNIENILLLSYTGLSSTQFHRNQQHYGNNFLSDLFAEH